MSISNTNLPTNLPTNTEVKGRMQPTQEQIAKMNQAQKDIFEAKGRIGLNELEMMKVYTFYFDLNNNDFKVEKKEGQFGDYGILVLIFQDMKSNEPVNKELIITGDDIIEKFLSKLRQGIVVLNIKKVEYKGKGNRKFDIEVEAAA